MAENFEFKFDFDWSQAERSTAEFVKNVQAQLNRLQQTATAGAGNIASQQAARVPTKVQTGTDDSGNPVFVNPQKLGQEYAKTAALNAQIGVAKAQTLSADKEYVKNLAALTSYSTQEIATKQRLLAGDDTYNRSLAEIASANARSAAAKQRILAGDAGYIESQASLSRSNAQIAAVRQTMLASDGRYAAAQAVQAQATAQIQAQRAGLLASDQDYIRAQASIASANQRAAARKAEILATDERYLESTAALALANRERAARVRNIEQTTLLGTPARTGPVGSPQELIGLEAENQVNARRLAAQRSLAEAAAVASGPGGRAGYIGEQADAQTAQRELSAEIRAETTKRLSASEAYIDALAQTGVAQRQLRARVERQVAETVLDNPTILKDEVAAAKARRAQTERRRALEAEAMLSNEHGELDDIVRRRTAEKRLQEAIDRRVKEELGVAQASTQGGPFQRAQQYLARRTGQPTKDAGEYATATQFLGSKAITTAGFALSGAVLFGGAQAIRSSIDEANKFELALVALQAELKVADETGRFPEVRRSLIDISNQTGVAGSEIAAIASQLRAAYGDTAKAIEETGAAAKVAITSGLDTKEITDGLTATSLAFNRSIEDIGNTAIGLETRTGVLAKQTIGFLADIAPVAASANVSLEQMAAAGAVAQKYSGRPATALAENFNRVLPALQANGAQILDLFNRIPGLDNEFQKLAKDLNSGDTGAFFSDVAANFDKLDSGSQKLIVELVGGRREAGAVIPVLEHWAEVQANAGSAAEDAGKLNERFKKTMETLQKQLQQLGVEFRNFIGNVMRGGLLDVLKDAIAMVGLLFQGLGNLAKVFDIINEATGGWAAQIVALLVILKTLQLTLNLVRGSGLASTVSGGAGALAGNAVGAGALSGSVGVLRGVNSMGDARVAGALVGSALLRSPIVPVLAGDILAKGISAIPARPGTGGGQLRTILTDTAKGAGYGAGVGSLIAPGPGTAIGAILGGAGGAIHGYVSALGQQTPAQKKADDEVKKRAKEESRRVLLEYRKQVEQQGGTALPFDKFRDYAESGVPGSNDIFDNLTGNTGASKADLDRIFTKPKEAAAQTGAQAKKNIDAVLKYLGDGSNVERDKVVEKYLEAAAKNPATHDAAQAALDIVHGQAKAKEAQDKVAKELEGALPNLQQLQAGYAVGKASAGDVRAGFQHLLAGFERAKAAGSLTDPKLLTAYYQTLQASQQFELQTATDANNLATALDTAQNFGVQNQSLHLQQDVALLNNAGIAPHDKVQIAIDLLQSLGQAEVQAIFQASSDANAIVSQLMSNAAALSPEQLAGATAALQQVFPGITPQQVQDIATKQKQAQGFQYTQSIHSAQGQIAQANAGPNPVSQARAARGAAGTAVADAEAYYNTVKTPEAFVSLMQARAGLASASQSLSQAVISQANAISQASLALLAAKTNDPVEKARIAVLQADAAAAAARSTGDVAGQIQAQAQRIQALNQQQQSIDDIANSTRELAVALRTFAGDVVGAAVDNLVLAQQQLQQAIDQNKGDAAINRAKIAVINAQASVRDTQLQDFLDTIDFQLHMNQISIGQAVTDLRSRLAVGNLTAAQQRDLQTKIYDLEHQVAQNLQFDLPSELRLPTLYEARRTAQLGGNTASYQDSRIVNFHIYDASDPQAVANTVFAQLNAPARYGTVPRAY